MSREILFRGKGKDNGEWVYGCYIKSVVRNGIFGYITGNKVVEPIKILKKTLGQYTGLTDKNGTKIFEGDIVKWDEKEWGCPYNELVKFDYELLAMRKHDYEQWCEVIGNIHDNPELLGEEK